MALVLCGVIPLAFLGGILFSIAVERQFGPKAADKYNLLVLVTMLIGVIIALWIPLLFVVFSVPPGWFIGLRIILCVSIVSFLIAVLLKRFRHKGEDILFDLGRAESKFGLLPGMMAVITTCVSGIQIYTEGEFQLDHLLDAATWGSLMVFWFVFTFSKVYITKEGVLRFQARLLKWDRVTNYSWNGRNMNKIILSTKGGGKIEFTIPEKHKTQLDKLLWALLHPNEQSLPPVGQDIVQN